MKIETIYFKSKMEISRALGRDPKTISKWASQGWFPTMFKRGWRKDAVLAAVELHNDKTARNATHNGSRAEKTRLECSRLRVMIAKEKESLKQSEIETKRQNGLVVEIADVKTEMARLGALLKGRVESFRQHETAKRPEVKDAVDRLANTLIEDMHGALVETQ